MTISQTAEYALRAVVWLAGHAEAATGTPEIARSTRVPPGYLAKVLQLLARGGLVTSAPGRKGGFRLARPAAEISILEVINAVDPVERIRQCPLGIESHGGELCPLHRRLDKALGLMEQTFAEATIAVKPFDFNTLSSFSHEVVAVLADGLVGIVVDFTPFDERDVFVEEGGQLTDDP